MHPNKVKTICVDFDGTIVDNSNGYQGCGVFGDILPGAKEALVSLFCNNWRVIIWTSREEIDLVEKYLRNNGIQFSFIEHKTRSDIYIDDRAMNFNGAWEGVLDEILDFKPWCDKKEEK